MKVVGGGGWTAVSASGGRASPLIGGMAGLTSRQCEEAGRH